MGHNQNYMSNRFEKVLTLYIYVKEAFATQIHEYNCILI